MLLDLSILLLENFYSTGISHDDGIIFIVQATGVYKELALMLRMHKLECFSTFRSSLIFPSIS